MYCGKCGAPNPDTGKFCTTCGAAIGVGGNAGSQQPAEVVPTSTPKPAAQTQPIALQVQPAAQQVQPIMQQSQPEESNDEISENAKSNIVRAFLLCVTSMSLWLLSGTVLFSDIDDAIWYNIAFHIHDERISRIDNIRTYGRGAAFVAAVIFFIALYSKNRNQYQKREKVGIIVLAIAVILTITARLL